MNIKQISLLSLLAVATSASADVLNAPPLSLQASLAIKQMVDSNVFLQSEGPLANRTSAVSVITPAFGLTLKNPGGTSLSLKLDYAPSLYFFSSYPGENHTDHLVNLKLSGAQDRWSYDASTSLLAVDGDDQSFRFYSPDGAPALGAPALRDRRDQLTIRGTYNLKYTADTWFVRPVATLYNADYHIQQQAGAGICNWSNRSDYGAGLDMGILLSNKLWGVAGYRFGYQEQGTILASPTQVTNTYHRALVGAEGSPLSWLKFNLLAGPDFRTFNDRAPAGISDDTRLYLEGAVTATFSKSDELAFTAKHNDIAASGGKTLYTDSAYELTWKHTWDERWSSLVAAKVCGGEWDSPTHRDDWVYSARAVVTCKLDAHWSLEAGYLLELGRSADRSLDGRDYDRHLGWLGARFDF